MWGRRFTAPYVVLGEDARSGDDSRLYSFGGGDFRFAAPRIAVGASEAASEGMCERPRRGRAKYKFGVAGHRIYRTSVASVYPHYVSKVEKKAGRSRRLTRSCAG